MHEINGWSQLTVDQQGIIAPKLTYKNRETAEEAFNILFKGENAEETIALVTAVKNLIDNAGGFSKSEVWRQILTVDGGWLDERNRLSAALNLTVDNSRDFLSVLRNNGYDVNRYYEVFSNHKHSARFITEYSSQPGMHFVQEDGYPDNKFDVHWDPRSSAFKKVNWKYYLMAAFAAKALERIAAGRSHTRPISSVQVRDELKKMGIVRAEDSPSIPI